jgi:hypothetical protein
MTVIKMKAMLLHLRNSAGEWLSAGELSAWSEEPIDL